MNKLKEIKRLRELAEKHQLEDREILGKYPMNRLAQIYNGIGPDAFPAWLRGCVTALHPSLAAVAFIHDVEWFESDGTDEAFKATNDRFKRNGYKVAEAEFGWWNPRRYAVMNQARRFGNYCQMFGKGGWLKCHEARLKQEAEDTGAEAEKAGPAGDNQ